MTFEKEDTVRSLATRTTFAAGLLAALFTALPDTVQANMMSACEPEIASICNGVAKGRGRIAACLYANDDKLSSTCKSEVDTVSTSSTFQKYLPTGVSSAKASENEANLRASCTTEADKVCTDVQAGNNRTLACVYAWSKSVSNACSAAANSILN